MFWRFAKKFLMPLVPALTVAWEMYGTITSVPGKVIVAVISIVTSFLITGIFLFNRIIQAYLLMILAMVLMGTGIWLSEDQTIGNLGVSYKWIFIAVGFLMFLSGLAMSSEKLFFLGDNPIEDFGEMESREEDKELQGKKVVLNIQTLKDKGPISSAQIESLIQKMLEKISFEKVQFMAFFRKKKCLACVDMLQDIFKEKAPKKRIEYLKKGIKLHHLVDKLNAYVENLETGNVYRLVVDVEQGAIVHYHISQHYFVVGMTVDQNRVDDCDKAVGMIVNESKQCGLAPV